MNGEGADRVGRDTCCRRCLPRNLFGYELFTKKMLATWMVEMGSDIMYVTFVVDVVGETASDTCGQHSWRHY